MTPNIGPSEDGVVDNAAIGHGKPIEDVGHGSADVHVEHVLVHVLRCQVQLVYTDLPKCSLYTSVFGPFGTKGLHPGTGSKT